MVKAPCLALFFKLIPINWKLWIPRTFKNTWNTRIPYYHLALKISWNRAKPFFLKRKYKRKVNKRQNILNKKKILKLELNSYLWESLHRINYSLLISFVIFFLLKHNYTAIHTLTFQSKFQLKYFFDFE